jgi:hypothetical protein
MMQDDIAKDRQGVLWGRESREGSVTLLHGSCFEVLPSLKPESFDYVITSPPYCNRYDYTRTYALELAFLGYSDEEVKALRQALLSATVENREKLDQLRAIYQRGGSSRILEDALRAFEEQQALHEVLAILDEYRRSRTLNNSNIPRMIRNYFLEMAVVIFELARVLRLGGKIAMVNDNVRYAGEEVPVDLILSDFAEAAGLSVDAIWTLNRGKGNSSQQMGNHGRTELRKCVYVWTKP